MPPSALKAGQAGGWGLKSPVCSEACPPGLPSVTHSFCSFRNRFIGLYVFVSYHLYLCVTPSQYLTTLSLWGEFDSISLDIILLLGHS